jgi:hypothetical protein
MLLSSREATRYSLSTFGWVFLELFYLPSVSKNLLCYEILQQLVPATMYTKFQARPCHVDHGHGGLRPLK